MRFFAAKSVLRRFLGGAIIALSIFSVQLSPGYAQAAAGEYKATPVSISGNGSLTMKPGEAKEVTVTVQNAGTQTWKNDGAGYISLYTYEPKYRKSVFDPGTWLGPSQVKRIREASVAPGKLATFVFQLRAPATAGTYTEVFKMASEDTAWLENGEIRLKIVVSDTSTTSSTADGYGASLSMRSANRIKAVAGRSVLFTAGFQNTGTKTWTSYGLVAPDVTTASTSSGTFTHPSWSGNQIATATGASVKPGSTATIQFSFTAPKTNGSHMAKFQLAANGVNVPDAYVEIPVEVTGGAAEAIDAEENENADAIQEKNLIEEPIIRVGVMIVDEETENEIVVTSTESDFTVTDLTGNVLASLDKNEEATAYYESGKYYYEVDGEKESSASALRFVPETENAVMTVTNFDRRETRNAANADNTFRHVLEIRYNESKDRIWLINELPMESYLKGLVEISDLSPHEAQKSLMTAARTYGFYHWTRATKHAKEYFHVDAYADQVYNGYGAEARTPQVSKAVESTRGVIVTYQGETAITPYFSRSDGRTRSWSEVWYGEVAWNVSVPVPCEVGKTLWGHGVGMSAQGSLCMARDGDTWDEILKHFYTGVDLTIRWK